MPSNIFLRQWCMLPPKNMNHLTTTVHSPPIISTTSQKCALVHYNGTPPYNKGAPPCNKGAPPYNKLAPLHNKVAPPHKYEHHDKQMSSVGGSYRVSRTSREKELSCVNGPLTVQKEKQKYMVQVLSLSLLSFLPFWKSVSLSTLVILSALSCVTAS